MRNKIFLACLIALLLCNSAACESINLSILRFTSKTADNEQLLDEIYSTLWSILSKSKSINLIERENLDVIGREQNMIMAGLIDPVKASEIGKLAGCQYIIMGSFEQKGKITLHARIVNTSNGEIIFSYFDVVPFIESESIFAAASRLAYKIIHELTDDYPKIININDGYITIDRGNNYGVCIDDLYRIYTEESIPENFDESLGRNIANLAVIKIISVSENSSTAKLIDNAGNYDLIQTGDKIEPISGQESENLIINKNFAAKRPNNEFVDYEEFNAIINEAEKGDSEAQWKLGSLYSQGIRVKQSYSQALKWYLKSAAQGNMKSQYNLGRFYYNGLGVEQDYKLAFEYFMKAAQQNLWQAQYKVAEMYHKGQYVEQNPLLALEWYTKAAQQGAAIAQNAVGDMYRYGGKTIDLTRKYTFVESNKDGRPEIHNGIEINFYQAVKWYKKAAKQEYARAQYNLGMMYHKGLGVKINLSKAYEWYSKAAAKGNFEAEEALKILEGYRLGNYH